MQIAHLPSVLPLSLLKEFKNRHLLSLLLMSYLLLCRLLEDGWGCYMLKTDFKMVLFMIANELNRPKSIKGYLGVGAGGTFKV